MKNMFKILSIITCLLGVTLSANTNSLFMPLDKKVKKANEDWNEFFKDLHKQKIIPTEFKLSKENLAQNNRILYSLFEAIKQNPDLNPDKNLYIKAFLEKTEKLNYLQLRQLIGCMQTNEGTSSKTVTTLTEQDKNKTLTTLHELYKFKNSNGTYPFRSTIRDIFIYISYVVNMSNLKYSRTNKFGTLALLLDKIAQQILKIKESNPSFATSNEDILSMTNTLKSHALQKSILKKFIINTAIATVTIVIIAAIIWFTMMPKLQTLEVFIARITANFLNQVHDGAVGVRGLGAVVSNRIPVPEYQN